jgi:GTPase SAR1 family protein
MGDLLTGAELHRRLSAQAHPAPARCPRLKLLLVGKANVGKTSVFKALKSSKKPTGGISSLLTKRGEGGNLSPSMLFGGLLPLSSSPITQLSTDGIDMEEWTPPLIEGAPVSFNVFDFAGQV